MPFKTALDDARPRSLTGLWLWSLPLIAALLLTAAGAWSYLWLQRSIAERVGDTLQTVLRADVQALTFWLDSQAAAIESTSRQAGVLAASRALVPLADRDVATLRDAPAAADWAKHIEAAVDNLHPAGYALLDMTGRVLASSGARIVGRRLSIDRSLLARLRQGETVFEPPQRPVQGGAVHDQLPPALAIMTSVMCADGTPCAILSYRHPPNAEFTRILNVARFGASGETYAFNDHGAFVSESRFVSQLVGLRLIPEQGSAILALDLRDPGEDLTRLLPGPVTRDLLSGRDKLPLTRMAQDALSGRTSMDLTGYRDYRGVLVVGAWTWLSKYNIGVTTEVDVDEAYAPVNVTRRAMVWPLALVIVATVLALVVSAKAQRLRTSLARSERELAQSVEELSELNRELEAFSYSVSHDLRAPLRHINGFVDLLQRRLGGTLDDTSTRHFGVIADAAKRMGALIDDLLAFSRTSRTDMHHVSVDLTALVHDAIADVTRDAERRAIDWRIQPLPTIRGDRAMLRVALVNLLANAVKYTRTRDQAIIEIGVQPLDARLKPGAPASSSKHVGHVVLFVKDNGVGFDMRYADKLFGVFQRLHRASEFEGTGIGLATVRRIVHRHGGRTWAEAEPGKGATFYFSLLA